MNNLYKIEFDMIGSNKVFYVSAYSKREAIKIAISRLGDVSYSGYWASVLVDGLSLTK